MTATERLREMLDERGVEWKAPASYDGSTKYDTIVDDYWFHEYDGGITVHSLNPEQAIVATLWPGTCHNIQFAEMDEKADKKHRRAIASVLYGGDFPEDEPAEFTCSACGNTALIDWVTLYDIRFCPFCGANVVDE